MQAEVLEPRELLTVFVAETVANTTRVLNQIDAVTAAAPKGQSVVVWTHLTSPTNADLRAQRFDSSGNKLGSEIIVARTSRSELKPAVAMDSFGNFVVTWQVLETTRPVDVIYYGLTKQRVPTPVVPPPTEPPPRNVLNVVAQRFAADGLPIGSLMTIANGPVDEFDPSIAITPLGHFAITYTIQVTTNNQDIRARLFYSNGTLQRDIDVANSASLNERRSSVARALDGRLIVAYESMRPNTSDSDIWVTQFYPSGNLQAINAVAVNTSSDDERPSLAIDRAGNAVVAWEHVTSPTNRDIWSRSVSQLGQLGSTLIIANGTVNEDLPSIAMHPYNGRYVVAYTSNGERVRVSEVSASGTIQRTTNLILGSYGPSVTVFEDNQFLVSYDRLISASRDILLRRGRLD